MGGRRRVGGKADFKAEWGAVGMRPGADGGEGVGRRGKTPFCALTLALLSNKALHTSSFPL